MDRPDLNHPAPASKNDRGSSRDPASTKEHGTGGPCPGEARGSASGDAEGCSGGAKGYLGFTRPSPWVHRFAPLVRSGGTVLDLACGNGRNGRLFLSRGHPVVFVDRDVHAVQDLAGDPRVEIVAADLEVPGRGWPFGQRQFAAVIGVNYLHRPLFAPALHGLEENGVLIYDTFARGNERLGRPRNPDHLLQAGELLDLVRASVRASAHSALPVSVQVVAYENGLMDDGACPGVKQRICAVKQTLAAGCEPAPVPVAPSEGPADPEA